MEKEKKKKESPEKKESGLTIIYPDPAWTFLVDYYYGKHLTKKSENKKNKGVG